jgi:hypothetical protein
VFPRFLVLGLVASYNGAAVTESTWPLSVGVCFADQRLDIKPVALLGPTTGILPRAVAAHAAARQLTCAWIWGSWGSYSTAL